MEKYETRNEIQDGEFTINLFGDHQIRQMHYAKQNIKYRGEVV